LPPIYDRASLELSEADRTAREAEGIAPHWRFRLDHGEAIEWLDGVRGPQHFEPAQLSDPVVRRADGSWLYMLPSAIDDIEMGVTDVLRGEDHVSNTALQIQMFTALGANRRASRTRPCSWAAKASCRSGSARSVVTPCARPASSPKRSWRCSRGWAPRSRSSRSSPVTC
jgi:hypothetical protein